MAFSLPPFYNHKPNLPSHLSIFLDPRFLNHPSGLVTGNPISIESSHLDFQKCFRFDDQAFRMNALSSLNLNSGAVDQRPALLYTSNRRNNNSNNTTTIGVTNEDNEVRTVNFEKWQSSFEWIKHFEQFQLQSLESRGQCQHVTDSQDVSSCTKMSDGVPRASGRGDEGKFVNVCRVQALKGSGPAPQTTENVLEISSFDSESRDVESCQTNGQGKREIKHSIREILKPRESSRVSKRVNSEDGASQIITANKDNRRGNGLDLWENSNVPQSFIAMKTARSSKSRHRKFKQRVISVFTMASSSITQDIDISTADMSGGLQRHPSSDLVTTPPACPRGAKSMRDFLDSPPMSVHSSVSHGHSERKTFQCPQCRYITDRKNNLKRHIVTMHQDSGKVLECCGIPFQSKAALRDHNTIFHRGGYRCQICARNFCRKALLRRHLTVHSGQKDFFCELCGYATSHKSNLERHQKVHIKRTPDSRAPDINKCNFPLNANADCPTVNLRSCDNFAYSFDHANDDIDIDVCVTPTPLSDEDSDWPRKRTLSDIITNSSNFPLSNRGKRARFFTSRLEETYCDTDEKTSTSDMSSEDPTTTAATVQSYDPLLIVDSMETQTDNKVISQAYSVFVDDSETNTEIQSVSKRFDKGKIIRIADDILEERTSTFKENTTIDTLNTNSSSKVNVKSSDSEEDAESKTLPSDLKTFQKPQKKCRLCQISYKCEDCGQKMPSQQELQSHPCPKTLRSRIFDISLVTALHKGSIKLHT